MVHVWRLTRIKPGADENVFQEVHILRKGKSTVGRQNISNVLCNSLLVSRRHCILNVHEDGTLTILDLETSNGTYIGEQKILSGREITLLNGDHIGIGCPAAGPVFLELYYDSENVTRPFAFLVEVTTSEDELECSCPEVSSTGIIDTIENCIVEDQEKIDKRETLGMLVGMKRPASSSEKGCSPKNRKLSENDVQVHEEKIQSDQNDENLVVETCTSSGMSKMSTQLENVNSVTAHCSNLKVQADNNNEKQENVSNTEKSDNSDSLLRKNIVDNKTDIYCNENSNKLASKTQKNLHEMSDSVNNHLNIKSPLVKDNKLYMSSERNVKLGKVASTGPNREAHELCAISGNNGNLKDHSIIVTDEKEVKNVNNSVLSTLSYSLEDSIICLDSDDEMPSSQIFDDVQIKIEPIEDMLEENKEEWEAVDSGDDDHNNDDDYDEISVITEDFDRPWIDRLTKNKSSKVGNDSTERASRNDSDNEGVIKSKHLSVNKDELSADLDYNSDKDASKHNFNTCMQNKLKSQHVSKDVYDLVCNEKEKIIEIIENDTGIINDVKTSKQSRSDTQCNVTKKNTYNTGRDQIIRQSSSETCDFDSSNKYDLKRDKATLSNEVNGNKPLQNFKNSMVHNIVAEDAKNSSNNNRNANAIHCSRQSDLKDENNIEDYNSYKDYKNSVIESIKSYRRSVDGSGQKNNKCNVLENKDVEISTVEPEASSTKENNQSIKETKCKPCMKKAILVDAAPLPTKQTKRRKSEGMIREQTDVETGNKQTNKILKKQKLREIAEKQNFLANKSDRKTDKGRGSAKIKMTLVNRADRLVNEMVNNTICMSNCKKNNETTRSFVYKIPKRGTEELIDSNLKISSTELVHENSKQIVNSLLAELHSGSCLKNITNTTAPMPSTSSKRVAFSSDVTVHEIEFMESCKKKPVKKDVPLVHQNSAVQKPNKVLCKDRNILSYPEDTVYDVCSWNIVWCEEQQRLPNNLIPPVCNQVICQMKDDFVSFEDYRRCLYPLLLIELWTSISTSHNSLSSKRFLFNAAVDDTQEKRIKSSINEKPGDQPKMFLIMTCHLLLTQDLYTQNSYPRYGDIIGIEFTVLPDTNCKKKIIERRFAYVSGARCVPFDERRNFAHQELLKRCPAPKYIVYITLSIKGRGGRAVDKSVFVKIRPLKNIVSDLRVFQALEMLPNSPLGNVILSPTTNYVEANIDDTKDTIYYSEMPLNKSQTKAVISAAKMCVEGKTGITFIHGPPGTGKSHVIVSLIMQIWMNLYRKSKPRILLCAPSNAAVDEIVARLLKIRQTLSEGKKFRIVRNGRTEITNPHVRNVSVGNLAEKELAKDDETQHDIESRELEISLLKANQRCISLTIDSYKEKNQDTSGWEQKLAYVTKKINDYQNPKQNDILADERRRKKKEKEILLLQHANIIATTLSSCFNSQMENAFRYSRTLNGEENLGFTCCIVDEATQCSEADTLIPLMLGIKTLVLVGDPQQLPATILSQTAKDKGLSKSLFARNYAWMSSREGKDHAKLYKYPLHLLDTQYRMHPAIAEWPSSYFYSRKLHTETNMEKLRRSPLLPYVILSLESDQADTREENFDERKVIINLLSSIMKMDACKDMSFGIVTPYQKQRQGLINDLKDMNALTNNVEVGTIDSFQGRERDVIIISCVRTDGIGFLSDPQRLNVALTRARRSLIVCGNFISLEKDGTWKSLLNNARKRKTLKHVNQEMIKHSESIFDLVTL